MEIVTDYFQANRGKNDQQDEDTLNFQLNLDYKYKFMYNLENVMSKLNFYKLMPYLLDKCMCLGHCRSRQTLKKKHPELGSGWDQ